MTGVTTGCIGLLPAYATIGIRAPALLALLRFLQGIPAGRGPRRGRRPTDAVSVPRRTAHRVQCAPAGCRSVTGD
ncbi:hypothetical protein ACFVT1_28585 [Streptomyces sp. NPDC057963]|uniref:hypothetical protein n=1 Tax=Streptomyces sp. NPDC057963 TaxID=3346290 RepID=UPI0036ED048D